MRSLVSLRAFITVLKWELIWTRSFNAPILSLSNLDLTGDGIEEIAVATTRGLQILQHDITKVQVKPVRPINQFLIWKAAQTLKYRDLVAPAKKFICSPSSFCHLRLHLLRREWEKLNNEIERLNNELNHEINKMNVRRYEHTEKFNKSWAGKIFGKEPLPEIRYIPKTDEK